MDTFLIDTVNRPKEGNSKFPANVKVSLCETTNTPFSNPIGESHRGTHTTKQDNVMDHYCYIEMDGSAKRIDQPLADVFFEKKG